MRPPEEVKRELARQWLSKAQEDLGVAEHLLGQSVAYRNAIGFHAQQAVEKCLKAFLVWHQIEFPKTHDIGELLDLIAKIDSILAGSLRGATALNPYGVATRYPGDLTDALTPEDARGAVEIATMVRDAVRDRIRLDL